MVPGRAAALWEVASEHRSVPTAVGTPGLICQGPFYPPAINRAAGDIRAAPACTSLGMGTDQTPGKAATLCGWAWLGVPIARKGRAVRSSRLPIVGLLGQGLTT